MGQPEPFQGDRPPQVDARLLRTSDLIDLRLEAPGCTLEPGASGMELVAGADASLVIHFPPQHLGEEVWQTNPWPPVPNPPPLPNRASRHVAAGPSRLVYELPEGTRIGFGLEQVLAALPGLRLRVAAGASPAGESGGGGPEPPTELETAIEAPYRIIVSPSGLGSFTHSSAPVGPVGRAELWRTRLGVRRDDGGTDLDDATQRIVRGLWSRDGEQGQPDPQDPRYFEQPLTAFDREAIVTQTNGGNPENADTPLLVDRLELSSLGAWFDWKQHWDSIQNLVDYRHQSFMGRDGYVRTAYPGFLYPFGHRCYLVQITEREIKHRAAPVAYLWQRWFIIVRQPVRDYPGDDRSNPFVRVGLGPLTTPDLQEPPGGQQPFVPYRNGSPFQFTLTARDHGGGRTTWQAPLVFVQAGRDGPQTFVFHPDQAASAYAPVRIVQGRGQSLALAAPVKAGDTSVEVTHLVLNGVIDVENVTSSPFITELRAIVPSMRHLAPQAPAVDLVFAQPYLDNGLPVRGADQAPVPGAPNAGELILALTSPAVAVDFSGGSDRSGGFMAPNLSVRGISRALGAIGENGNAPSAFDAGTFDPASFLAGALPKLFGLFSLTELLKAGGLDEAPAFVSDALDTVTRLLAEARELGRALADARTRLEHEVQQAAHAGARGIAQHAKDQLEAVAGPLESRLGELVAAVASLPGGIGAVGTALGNLGTELRGLATAIAVPGVPAAVRSALRKPANALADLGSAAGDLARLEKLLSGAAAGKVTARMSWRPVIGSWGLDGAPDIFKPNDQRGLHLDVEVTASASAPPSVDILAEIVDFDLNLIGDAETGLMKLKFRRIGFHAGSGTKSEVDVVFGGISFLGPLSFVDRLRELIPFDGFSDPPFVDITPAGIGAGFDLTLPNVSIGVFSLENITLGADARIPFLGDAMSVGFHFCSKDAPFRLTVMCIGGGGWLVLRASPKGLVLLELGLEACASLSVDLGVASGSVSIAVGVYLRLEGTTGMLAAYFRIRGEVEVLGLISASITLELSLAYQFNTGKLIGRASLVVDVEVLFFSASVEIVVERRLAGSKGDPTMKQVMPPDAGGMNADWASYCDAFAPLPG